MTDFIFVNGGFQQTERYGMDGTDFGSVFGGGDASEGWGGTIAYGETTGRFWTWRVKTTRVGGITYDAAELGYYVGTSGTFTRVFLQPVNTDSPGDCSGSDMNTPWIVLHILGDEEQFVLHQRVISGAFSAQNPPPAPCPGFPSLCYSPANNLFIVSSAGGSSHHGPISAYTGQAEHFKGRYNDTILTYFDFFDNGMSDLCPGDFGLTPFDQYVWTIDAAGSGLWATETMLAPTDPDLAAFGADWSFKAGSSYLPYRTISDDWKAWKFTTGAFAGTINLSGLPGGNHIIASAGPDRTEANIYVVVLNLDDNTSAVYTAPVTGGDMTFTFLCNISTPFGGFSPWLTIGPWETFTPVVTKMPVIVTLIGAT